MWKISKETWRFIYLENRDDNGCYYSRVNKPLWSYFDFLLVKIQNYVNRLWNYLSISLMRHSLLDKYPCHYCQRKYPHSHKTMTGIFDKLYNFLRKLRLQ